MARWENLRQSEGIYSAEARCHHSLLSGAHGLREQSVLAILHASHNLFIQGFFTPLTGSRGTLTAYVIDEFGAAVPLVIVLIAIGLWLKHKPAVQLQIATA